MTTPGNRQASDDGGYSLVEMLVVLLLLGIVGTVVTKGIVTTLRSTRIATQRAVALSQLQTAADRLSRELRAAEAPTDPITRLPTTAPLITAIGTSFTADVLRAGHRIRFRRPFRGPHR